MNWISTEAHKMLMQVSVFELLKKLTPDWQSAVGVDVRYEATSIEQNTTSVFGKCGENSYFLLEYNGKSFNISVLSPDEARVLWGGRLAQYID